MNIVITGPWMQEGAAQLHSNTDVPLLVHERTRKLYQPISDEKQREEPHVVCMSVMLSPFKRIRPAAA